MPLGIVSPEEFNKEVIVDINVDRSNMPARPEIITNKPLGRNNKPEVPEEIRSLIAQEALLGAPSKQLAKEFNVSVPSVSAYKNGATSTASYNEGDKRLKNKNHIFKDRIVRRAGRLSLTALDSIDTADFATASLMDKVNAAKSMASIVRDMTPDIDDGKNYSPVQIVIHAPQMKSQDDYIDGSIISID